MVSWIEKLDDPEFTLPGWVKWLAQDADGTWWAYECEPNQFHSGWYENEVGRSVRLRKEQGNCHWQESLRKL